MYLDFTYFAKQESDWLSISSLISMFGKEVDWMEKPARAISSAFDI